MAIKTAISGKYMMMPSSKQTPSGLSEPPAAHFGIEERLNEMLPLHGRGLNVRGVWL